LSVIRFQRGGNIGKEFKKEGREVSAMMWRFDEGYIKYIMNMNEKISRLEKAKFARKIVGGAYERNN